MIVAYERIRDRVEEILPDQEEYARSSMDLAIWLGATQDQIESACQSLWRFRAAQRKLDTVKHKKWCGNTTRWLWWRAV